MGDVATARDKGQWVEVQVRNPESVCCDESLMVCALRTVGVAPHPRPNFAFYSRIEDEAGKPVTIWRWMLAARSSDGKYSTGQLIKWWRDPAWRKANPAHEFAIVCTVLGNMGVHAKEVRTKVARVVVRKGDTAAHIPVNASPARRAHLLGQLDGKIPLNQRFVEPQPEVVP